MTFYEGEGLYPKPRAMTEEDIREAVEGFAASAVRARDAGFDGVEIHGANGYLLDQFLTDYTNGRVDSYGGQTKNRVRLTAQVVRAVRTRVGPDFVVGVRVSQGKVNDFTHKWAGAEADAEAIFAALRDAGADYIHITEFEADKPAFADSAPLSVLARRCSGLPVVANGSLHDPGRAATLIAEGGADIVALARGALANVDWPKRVRNGAALRLFDPAIIQPVATLQNEQASLSVRQLWRA